MHGLKSKMILTVSAVAGILVGLLVEWLFEISGMESVAARLALSSLIGLAATGLSYLVIEHRFK